MDQQVSGGLLDRAIVIQMELFRARSAKKPASIFPDSWGRLQVKSGVVRYTNRREVPLVQHLWQNAPRGEHEHEWT